MISIARTAFAAVALAATAAVASVTMHPAMEPLVQVAMSH